MFELATIREAEVCGPHRLRLTFADGFTGEVDLADRLMAASGLLAALRDPAYFSQVRVDPDSGTVAWPNGVDLDPDVLYARARGAAIKL